MIANRIRIKQGETVSLILKTTSLFSGLELYEYTPLPLWVAPSNFGNPYIVLLDIDTSGKLGEYEFFFTLGGSPSLPDVKLIIEVLLDYFTYIQTCSSTSNITLVWLTREGGKASFIFDQRKDYGYTNSDSKVYETANGATRKYAKGNVYKSFSVFKTGTTNNDVDYLSSLKNCLQAWIYDTSKDVSDSSAYTEIFIDENSFSTYSTKAGLNEVVINYRMSNKLNYQNG